MSSTALSGALAAIDSFNTEPSERDALIRAKCRALLVGYDQRWKDAGFVTLAVEQVHSSPLINPNTGKPSRSFLMAGAIDVEAERRERRFIIDHKTASADISDPNGTYWQQLTVEGQASHYQLLKTLEGEKPDGVIWDVTRKPTIGPRTLTKAIRAATVADRKYFGRELSMDTLAGLQTEEPENLEMYEARLIHDCTVERPEWYFQRRAIPRLDREIVEYAEDLWQHSQNMLASRKAPRIPKNSGACMLYGSPCQFLGICSGHDTPDSDKWKRKKIRHPELGEAGKIDALTNSRIRCFQTCPMKHYYQYELGIERQDEEEKEALYFGSCYHRGLNAWWRTFLPEGKSNGSLNEAAASI